MEQARQSPCIVTPLPRRPDRLAAAIEQQRQGDRTTALALCERHIAERPEDVEGWVQLAQVQRRCGQLDAAIVSLQRALRLAPRDAVVWSNLGDTWLALGQCEQALRCHRRAVETAPERMDLCLHLIAALRRLQKFAELEQRLADCLRREPGRTDLREERALLMLYTGRWREAWPDFGCRVRVPLDCRPGLATPYWSGERIGARHLLLVADPDIGTTLWAARFVPMLARRGARLSLVAPPSLHPLLAGLPVRLLVPGEARLHEPYDYIAPLAHLAWLADLRSVAVPEPASLCIDRLPPVVLLDDEAHARELRVGVAWVSANEPGAAAGDQPGAALFADLALLPGVRMVSLHMQESAGAQPPFPSCGLDPATLAAVITTLDVVVTADERVAHLAGCIGTPVLHLLPYTPGWLWGVRGDACPWYPAMRLLRQPDPGRWDPVFEEAGALIRGWARARAREQRRQTG